MAKGGMGKAKKSGMSYKAGGAVKMKKARKSSTKKVAGVKPYAGKGMKKSMPKAKSRSKNSY